MSLSRFCFFVVVSSVKLPDGPQGPTGVVLKYDLLSISQSGATLEHLFLWPAAVLNGELPEYVPEAAIQDPNTNEITITAKKEGSRITSARIS